MRRYLVNMKDKFGGSRGEFINASDPFAAVEQVRKMMRAKFKRTGIEFVPVSMEVLDKGEPVQE